MTNNMKKKEKEKNPIGYMNPGHPLHFKPKTWQEELRKLQESEFQCCGSMCFGHGGWRRKRNKFIQKQIDKAREECSHSNACDCGTRHFCPDCGKQIQKHAQKKNAT